MSPNRLLTLGFFSILVAACAGSPTVTHPAQKQQAIDNINRILERNHGNGGEFESSLSNNEKCFVTAHVKWPIWRLDDSNYSDATTSYTFDWSEVESVSYKISEEKRPPNYSESRHFYISVDFIKPQRYKTAATVIGGKKYDGMGFADGLELYVSEDDSADAQKAVDEISKNRDDCSIGRAEGEWKALNYYSPDDQYQIANAYRYSRHPAPKFTLAYEFYLKSAQRGNLNSQLQLGSALRSGLNGVPRDLVAARYWFEAAAAQGDLLALDMLGDFYEKGVGGVDADPVKAAKYYRLAAEGGVLTAQESLAEMLHFGKGIPKNINEARMWYRKAAEAGSESARNALVLIDKNE